MSMKKIRLHNLISLARQETPPAVDVADSVLATLSGMAQGAPEPARAYFWTGMVSAAVAAGILIDEAVTLQSGSDSVNEMMSYVSWVAQ